MNKTYNRLRHYTIIELLLVITVMGILMAVSVGGITMVIKSTGTSGGVRNVGNRISMARTFSISSNVKVAVVFPGIAKVPTAIDSSGYIKPNLSNNTLKKKYYFRSYRTCVVEWDDTVTPNRYKFIRWSNGGEWSFLPNSTCINCIEGDFAKVNISSALASKFDSDQSGAVDLPAIVFCPAGSLDPNMSATEMKLIVFDDNYNPEAGRFMINGVDPSDASGNTVGLGWCITVNQFTGGLTFEKRDR